MSKTYTGINIGAGSVKMTQVSNGVVSKRMVEAVPENLIRDGRILSVEAMGDFLKQVVKGNQLKSKDGAVVIPAEQCYLRRATMPYMTLDQMKLNLPYEFRDYIHADREDYIYDYAVVGEERNEEGDIVSQELLIAAVKRDVIDGYARMLGMAGLRLKIALPEPFAFRNIIREYEKETKVHPQVYCIVDMGHTALRIHLFEGDVYETTRVIDFGGSHMDVLIADALDVDVYVASAYKKKNYEDVQNTEICRDLYQKMTVEIVRAINFYNYNNPDKELQDLYFCGGLAEVEPLMETITSTVEAKCHSIMELMPHAGQDKIVEVIASAVGVTMQ